MVVSLMASWVPVPFGETVFSFGSMAHKIANPQLSVIENTAHIIFNYNRSISTNTVFNTVNNSIFTSIENRNSNNELFIYPNPTHDKLTIIYPNPSHAKCELSIKNMLGEEVYAATTHTEKTELSTSKFQRGVYVLEFNCVDKKQCKKLVFD